MRWTFPDPADRSDAAARAQTIRKIDAWWAQFASRTGDLDAMFNNRRRWDLPDWMHQTLQSINPHLMWEYGQAVRGPGHRLVITPESRRDLCTLAQAIVDRAPAIPGWEFYRHRLPEDIDGARASVAARVPGASIDGMRVAVTAGDLRRINLTFESPLCREPDDHPALDVAFVAAETLLGEELLDKWVGGIGVVPPPRRAAVGAARAVPLERLKPTVDALIAGMTEQLPDRPQHALMPIPPDEDARRWSAMEMKPPEGEDFAGWDDQFVAITPWPELFLAARHDPSFYSERFSRFGETFAYLKIDGSDLTGQTFADRGEIEDAVNAALVPAQLGCAIGGGTGRRYSYVELALTELPRAADAIRHAMRAGGTPNRTWLQFYDCEWSAEWIGMYPDTPAPPMPPPPDQNQANDDDD